MTRGLDPSAGRETEVRFSFAEIPALRDHVLEGTPFVPFAMVLDELARGRPDDGIRSLADVRLHRPIMLRKGRDRVLKRRSTSTGGVLVEGIANEPTDSTSGLQRTRPPGAGNPLPPSLEPLAEVQWVVDRPGSRTSAAWFGPDANGPFAASRGSQLSDAGLEIPPASLYPRILFHGPTFQGHFTLHGFSAEGARGEIRGFDPTPPALGRLRFKQVVPVMAADLAFQLAGLHALLYRREWSLPVACARWDVVAPRFAAEGTEDLAVHLADSGHMRMAIELQRRENGTYDICAWTVRPEATGSGSGDPGGASFGRSGTRNESAVLFRCAGLTLQPLSRPVDLETWRSLQDIFPPEVFDERS
jgi:hypothetical protein